MVGHIDLMPTILALANVKAPEQVTGRNILADSLEGSSEPIFRFSEAWAGLGMGVDYQRIPAKPPSFMVQQGSRKLSRYQGDEAMRYEAYDLDADPDERDDKIASDAAGYEEMKRLIDEYAETCATSALRTPSRRVELGAEREEKLRALGYLD
jgi:arylsulfatase A-like enzyme